MIMDITGWLSEFAKAHPWVPLVLSIYLVTVKALQGIRDAIDKTPASDDNIFERIVTILGKTIGYLGGVRPNAPAGSTTAAGSACWSAWSTNTHLGKWPRRAARCRRTPRRAA